MLLLGPMAEELGWRGYALPRLLAEGSAFRAAMVMGLVATVWHLPLFFSTYPPMYGIDPFGLTMVYYFLYTTGRCVLYVFVFQNTQHSVLMTVLFHAAGNIAMPMLLFSDLSGAAKSEAILWSAVPMWALALWLLWLFGDSKLKILDGPAIIEPVFMLGFLSMRRNPR